MRAAKHTPDGKSPRPDEVRALRLSAGLTQAALAKLCWVQSMTVSRWEQGVRRVDPLTWWAVRERVKLIAAASSHPRP